MLRRLLKSRLQSNNNWTALVITGLFALLSGFWILLTDEFLFRVIKNPAILILASVFKGWLFILGTSALIYFLILWYLLIQRESQAALAESEVRFRILSESAFEGVALIESDRILDVNTRFVEIFGYPIEELRNLEFVSLVVPEHRGMVQQRLHDADPDASPQECQMVKRDGTSFYAEAQTRKMPYQGREVRVTVLRDITSRRRFEEELRTISMRDELTGLYNRRGFFTLAEQQMKISKRSKKDLVLLFADLNGLKHINDTFGHQEGDQAIIDAANILKTLFRESDIVARIGGDEFVVLAIGAPDFSSKLLTERLKRGLDKFNAENVRKYQLAISTGLAIFSPEQPVSIDELLIQADRLMYQQKRAKTGRREGESDETPPPDLRLRRV
ncbi:MAG TPA: sensor domain-containing diguanylate cyclase [bacterium]|nr:sensor domain-containing diguanylate cyclase [bacterium]